MAASFRRLFLSWQPVCLLLPHSLKASISRSLCLRQPLFGCHCLWRPLLDRLSLAASVLGMLYLAIALMACIWQPVSLPACWPFFGRAHQANAWFKRASGPRGTCEADPLGPSLCTIATIDA